jgi:hypothetical protein
VNRLSSLAATLALAAAGAAFATDPEPPADAAAMAVEKPSPEAVRAFWNFYFFGKGQGLVLADAKLCTEIAKEGPNKSDCAKEISAAEGVKAPQIINVWQAYLVPKDDTIEDITIQLKLGDQIRETKDVKVNGASIRYRNWTGLRIPKAGKWTINIMRGSETLKSMELVAR